MAATFDAATDGTSGAATSISVTHTATGTDRAAFAGGCAVDGSPDLVSSGTYGGVAMTERWDAVFATFYTHFGLTLVAPATGAQTVTITFGGQNGNSSLAVVTATSVDQTTPFGTAATATGNSTTPSVAVSAATDDLVVDSVAYVGTGAATAGTGQTGRTANTSIGAEMGHATSTEAGAASVTMSWTIATANWAIGGIAFKAAAAGGSAASADGVGDAAAVGASTASASASSDGVSTTIATGASTATADYSANGDVPVAVFVGTSAVLGAASSDGVGDAQAVGSSTASSNYSADGEATTVAEGAGTATAVYAADGEGAATATGASTAASNYLAEGDVPTAVMVGDSVAAGQAAASSDGVGTATAEGASTAASAYTSDGEATAIADATSGSAPVVEEDVESGSSPQGGGYYAHNPWREYKKKRDKTLDLEEQEIIEIAMLAAQQITADYMNHGIS